MLRCNRENTGMLDLGPEEFLPAPSVQDEKPKQINERRRRRAEHFGTQPPLKVALSVFPNRNTIPSLFEGEVLFDRALKFIGQFQPALRGVEAALEFEHPAGHFLADLRKRLVHRTASLGDWNERKSALDHIRPETREFSPERSDSAMAANGQRNRDQASYYSHTLLRPYQRDLQAIVVVGFCAACRWPWPRS